MDIYHNGKHVSTGVEVNKVIKTNENSNNIAPAYYEAKEYTTESLVTYNGYLYECIADSTTGQFKADDWKKTTIYEYLKDHKIL